MKKAETKSIITIAAAFILFFTISKCSRLPLVFLLTCDSPFWLARDLELKNETSKFRPFFYAVSSVF